MEMLALPGRITLVAGLKRVSAVDALSGSPAKIPRLNVVVNRDTAEVLVSISNRENLRSRNRCVAVVRKEECIVDAGAETRVVKVERAFSVWGVLPDDGSLVDAVVDGAATTVEVDADPVVGTGGGRRVFDTKTVVGIDVDDLRRISFANGDLNRGCQPSVVDRGEIGLVLALGKIPSSGNGENVVLAQSVGPGSQTANCGGLLNATLVADGIKANPAIVSRLLSPVVKRKLAGIVPNILK